LRFIVFGNPRSRLLVSPVARGLFIRFSLHPATRVSCNQCSRPPSMSFSISIAYKTWKVVPKQTKIDIYDNLMSTFDIPCDKMDKKMILSNINNKWKTFKTNLGKQMKDEKTGDYLVEPQKNTHTLKNKHVLHLYNTVILRISSSLTMISSKKDSPSSYSEDHITKVVAECVEYI
ncbi:hypothetical protein V2J09_003816, partial [Rumex salicifolius]